MKLRAASPTLGSAEADAPVAVQRRSTVPQAAMASAGCVPAYDLPSQMLDALPAMVVLVDAAGVILSVNAAWRVAARANGFVDPAQGVGNNYLAVCDRAAHEGLLAASRAAAGIRAVLKGELPQYTMEYVIELPAGDRWYLLMVNPAGGGSLRGATLLHLDITARKHEEGNLWRFASAMESLADGVVIIDRASMAVTYVNEAACQLHRLSREQLMQLKPWVFVSMTREALEIDYDRIVTQGGIGEPEELFWRRTDGSQIWIEVRRHGHCLDGAVSVVVLLRDISARKNAESRIRYLNRVHSILSGINTLIVRAGTREELFREACRIPVEKGGFPVCWIGMIDPQHGRLVPVATAGMGAEYRHALVQKLARSSADTLEKTYVIGALRDKQVRVCNDSRSDKRVLVGEHHEGHGIRSFAILPLIVADQAVGVMGLYAGETDFFHDEELRLLTELAGDVSFAIDHIEKQERLDYLAFYDALTGLPNRHLSLDRLDQLIHTAEATRRALAVCVLDVERFQNFNDSLGRQAGDSLLEQVAQWLARHLGDNHLVGRLDSDHFTVVLTEVDNEAAAARIIEKLVNSFAAESFYLEEDMYRLALKVGVAMFPEDGCESSLLFKNAGAALTKAKAGRDPYLFFAQRMTDTVVGRMGMENQLRQALDRAEFVLHYQPKINLGSGQMVGAEALLRWNDPRTGLVPPARFIPLLEETGLIFEVGRWVLRQAIEDHIAWLRAGYPGVRVAVNVSPLQLRHDGFVADIERYAATHTSVASGLELEITESLVMEDVKRSIAALRSIRELGVTIAIDDFGTGYSSLSHLAKLPIDTLKIDRTFVSDMTAAPQAMSLVSTIINLAHSFNLKVIAEGVETQEQAGILHRLTCNEAQGFLYSKPLPAAAFREKYLRRGPN